MKKMKQNMKKEAFQAYENIAKLRRIIDGKDNISDTQRN